MKLRFSTNIYVATIYQLFISLFVFSLCRVFFYYYNIDLFRNISSSGLFSVFIGGCQFDLIAILYLNLLFILLRILPFSFVNNKQYQKWTTFIFFVFNGIGIIANIMDTPFFRFTNTRTKAVFLSEFMGDKNALGIMGGHLIIYWPLVFVAAFLILLLVFLYNRVDIRAIKFTTSKSRIITSVGIFILSAGLVVIGIRGGVYNGRPVAIADAIRYTEQNRDVNLVLNTPFSILRSIGRKEIVLERTYLPKGKVTSLYQPVYLPKTSNDVFKKKNIVIIILEGIGSAFIDPINNLKKDSLSGLDLMPFLNSLCNKSYICTNAYSTGRRSSEGINAVLGGFPAFSPFVYMNSAYNHNDIDGLPALLAPEGYQSVFYCGCNKGSYAFETFSKAVGYKRFVGREEYGNDKHYDGHWGIFDDKMGEYIIHDLKNEPQPFIASWFTISSHGPFTLPEDFKGRYRSEDRTMSQMVEYVDDVLKTFFTEAKRSDWYENTIFVITSDHASIMEDQIHNSPNSLYKVPLILFTPDGSLSPTVDTSVASQLDITPTILGLLNYNKTHISIGQDIFDSNRPRFAVNYVNNLYQIVQNDYLLQFDGEKSVALYNRVEDPLLTKNILSENPNDVTLMENLLKAFLQEYTHRIIENRLSAKREIK